MTAHADLPEHGPYGPVSRSLLNLRDAKVRRCSWCGSWAWALDDCTACETPAVRTDQHRETA